MAPLSAAELVPVEQLVEDCACGGRLRNRDAARGGPRLSIVAATVVLAVRRGRTELDLALAIDWRIRQAGFERPAFDTIVASARTPALPHARPSGRIISEGDLGRLDFGGVYDSYCVDLTRTVHVGTAGDQAREVYGAVREATIGPLRPWRRDVCGSTSTPRRGTR